MFTKSFDDFKILLNDSNVSLDILGLTESRIKKDSLSPVNHDLGNHSFEHTPTELLPGGTLRYISKRFCYQLRNELKVYHSGKVKSTFIETICSKSTNATVGCIYQYPILEINDFTYDFISPSSLKL